MKTFKEIKSASLASGLLIGLVSLIWVCVDPDYTPVSGSELDSSLLDRHPAFGSYPPPRRDYSCWNSPKKDLFTIPMDGYFNSAITADWDSTRLSYARLIRDLCIKSQNEDDAMYGIQKLQVIKDKMDFSSPKREIDSMIFAITKEIKKF